jgi:hypothetical protein
MSNKVMKKKTKKHINGKKDCVKCFSKKKIDELKTKNIDLINENTKLKNAIKELKEQHKKKLNDIRSKFKDEVNKKTRLLNWKVDSLTKANKIYEDKKRMDHKHYEDKLNEIKEKLTEEQKISSMYKKLSSQGTEEYSNFMISFNSKIQSLYTQVASMGLGMVFEDNDDILDKVFDGIGRILSNFNGGNVPKKRITDKPSKKLFKEDDDLDIDPNGVHMINDRTYIIENEFKKLYGNMK